MANFLRLCLFGSPSVDDEVAHNVCVDSFGRTISRIPEEHVETLQYGTAGEFAPSGNLLSVFQELDAVLAFPLQSRKEKVLQVVYSSKGATASISQTPQAPNNSEVETVDVSPYAAWFSWSFSKGRHAFLFFIDAQETRLGIDNEHRLQRFIQGTIGAKIVFKKKDAVVVTESMKCSAFACISIDAQRDGHLFVGFNPSNSVKGEDQQWIVRAPDGIYTPKLYDYVPNRHYYPQYALRSIQKRKLPIAQLGFEPRPEVARLRQEVLHKDTPGYEASARFWATLDRDGSEPKGE